MGNKIPKYDFNWSKNKKIRYFKEVVIPFFNSECVKCEGESGLANVERDHIIPTYQGGEDEIYNWQPLCARCNAAKGPESLDWRIAYMIMNDRTDKIPSEWINGKEDNNG